VHVYAYSEDARAYLPAHVVRISVSMAVIVSFGPMVKGCDAHPAHSFQQTRCVGFWTPWCMQFLHAAPKEENPCSDISVESTDATSSVRISLREGLEPVAKELALDS